MQNWELDRIHTWISAACTSSKNNQVKFLIDLNDRSLFNLILKNKEWKCVLNNEISVQYSNEQIKILENKIKALKSNNSEIREFPKLKKSKIDIIKKAKLELERNKEYKTDFDWIKYQKIIYDTPVNFGIKWLQRLGVEIEELSRIGF